jgi:hypothetical protein
VGGEGEGGYFVRKVCSRVDKGEREREREIE